MDADHSPMLARLERLLPPGELLRDVQLATLARWRIGGPADAVVTPASWESLAATLRYVRDNGCRYVIVGDGSNLLYDDAGFRGVVIRIGRAFRSFTVSPEGRVRAGAGWWVPAFVRRLINVGLSGAVHAIGIPGTLGGLLVMNGGSQRKSIGEHVVSVDVISNDGRIETIRRAELGLGYRASRLQQNIGIVIAAEFQFEPGDTRRLRIEAIKILADRKAKFPKVRANCGSVFVSDPKLYEIIGPPGMAIERAGLKGASHGDAQISDEHANFIVNNGNARSTDVLALIGAARARVHALTGVAMRAEVLHLDPLGCMRPAHEVAEDVDEFREIRNDGQFRATG